MGAARDLQHDEFERLALGARVADTVAVGLLLVDTMGRSLFRNDTMTAWFGELERMQDLHGWLPGVPLKAYVERVRKGGEPVDEPAVLLKRPGHPARLMELRLQPGPLENSALIMLGDVTDRARVQRLGALVETAMALGHEIANPLAILRGEIELLQREATEAASSRLEAVVRAADRIDGVLDRMRQLAEPNTVDYLPSRSARMIDLGAGSVPEKSAARTARRPPAPETAKTETARPVNTAQAKTPPRKPSTPPARRKTAVRKTRKKGTRR